MARQWLNAAVLVGVCGLTAVFSAHRSASAVSGASVDVARLETAVALHADDPKAVSALMRSYLEHDAPGLAVTVLERSPAAAFATPQSSDLAARALLGAGRASESLTVTRKIVAECDRQPCDASLVARASRREQVLTAIVDVGIEDADCDPRAVELALRRSVRQVRLALND